MTTESVRCTGYEKLHHGQKLNVYGYRQPIFITYGKHTLYVQEISEK